MPPIPEEQIICPGCGQKYGHHNTRVDTISEECSSCAKVYENINLVTAEEFIKTVIMQR